MWEKDVVGCANSDLKVWYDSADLFSVAFGAVSYESDRGQTRGFRYERTYCFHGESLWVRKNQLRVEQLSISDFRLSIFICNRRQYPRRRKDTMRRRERSEK